MQRSAAVTLLLIFLAAHLAFLPRTLEDLDSINFALGVRHFDVALHQPHPPGYPVFIAIAKLSTRALRAAGIDGAAPRGLAVWSAIAGTAALPALFVLFRSLERRTSVACWATVVTGTSPLFWSTALRPLSDMAGLAFAVASQTLALSALYPDPPTDSESGTSSSGPGKTGLSPDRALVAAGLIAGVAIGVRSQTAILTVPLLLYVLATTRGRVSGKTDAAALAAFAAGILWWAIPLLIASGGLSGYLTALNTQAGEDFSGVVMLWTHRTPRVAASAVLNTFVWPWGWGLGIFVCALGLIGATRILLRAPRAALVLAVAFGPYAIFHLLFHETETVRYALPLLPVVAYAAVAAMEWARSRLVLAGAGTAIAVASLILTLPASAVYAREGAPVFRLFDDMAATAHGGDPVDTVAMHAVARRAAEWSAPILPARVAKAPHGREWLTLVGLWRAEPGARVWFVADPKRTDLALFDPQTRDLARSYRWGFTEPPIVGGARPGNVDWYRMRPPGWMLGQGWSVTAEVGGVTARDHLGPHLAPAVAWLRRRSQELTVLLGGRVLGTSDGGPVEVHLTVNGTPLETWALLPGFFMRRAKIPSAMMGSAAEYVPLEVSARSAARVPVSLEQFDAQRPDVPMFGYGEGWNEPEYNQSLGRAWRWSSEHAVLWVRPIGRAVTLRIAGESPLRYYDSAPTVRLSIGGRQVATFQPSIDFDQSIALPPDLLAAADGRVVLECSRSFVPGAGGDQRHLSLRIFRVAVE